MLEVSMLESLSEYGILLVMAAIFLSAVMIIFKSNSKKYDVLFDRLVNEPKVAKPEVIIKSKVFDEKMHDILTEVLYSTDAARAFYIRFHNGEYDHVGHSLRKMSVTNEVGKPGVSPLMPDFQNQFQSIWYEPISEIEKSGYYYTESPKDWEEKHITTYEFLMARGVVKSYLAGVRNSTGMEIGILGIEYVTTSDTFDLDVVSRKVKEGKYCIEALLRMDI